MTKYIISIKYLHRKKTIYTNINSLRNKKYTNKPTSDNCNNVLFLFTRFKSIVHLNCNRLLVLPKMNPV